MYFRLDFLTGGLNRLGRKNDHGAAPISVRRSYVFWRVNRSDGTRRYIHINIDVHWRRHRVTRGTTGTGGSQLGGDFDVAAPVERGQPVTAGVRGSTAEFPFLPERHVVVGSTDDGRRRGRRRIVVGRCRRVERRVRPAERAATVAVGPVPAYARRSGCGRRLRAHGTVAVCNEHAATW